MMLVIYGPTVTGKTNLAIKIAKQYNGELISADSRQVYKDLDIGTGKVDFNSNIIKRKNYWIVNGIKIHGFDLVNPQQNFSAYDFTNFARKQIEEIKSKNKLAIIVGGSGFYIQSLLFGLTSYGVSQNLKLRQKLEKLSKQELYNLLLSLDKKRALKMNNSDRQNPRRLIRAIEILKANKTKPNLSAFKYEQKSYLFIGLTSQNDYLYKRADSWLQLRLKMGMEQEIKNLIKSKVNPDWLINLGLEYKWLTKYILKEINKEVAIKRLEGDIHNLIRKQKTWFSKFKNIKKFDISNPTWQTKTFDSIKSYLKN